MTISGVGVGVGRYLGQDAVGVVELVLTGVTDGQVVVGGVDSPPSVSVHTSKSGRRPLPGNVQVWVRGLHVLRLPQDNYGFRNLGQ